MALAILQFVLVLAAGGMLYLLWRRYVASARLGLIVTAGFLVRALAGQVLFWISWLELPFMRQLQVGNGLWFFAIDAHLYLPTAFAAADGGLSAIVLHDRTAASVTFVQVLSFFAWCFGKVTSVALLLNLFSYLGLCIIIIRWSAAAEKPGRRSVLAGRALALTALSLSPSAIVWSLQPLKDVLFQFLLVAFLSAAAIWQEVWRTRPGLAAWGAAVAMFITMFGIGGIRWYFAFTLLGATIVFAAIVTLTAGRRRALAAVSALLLVAALSQAFLFGGGPYIPKQVHQVLTATTLVTQITAIPGFLKAYVESARSGFDRVGGATTIRVIRKPSLPPIQVANRAEPAAAGGGRVGVPTARSGPDVPAIAATGLESSQGDYIVATSPRARIMAGAAAMLIPQTVARGLGLIEIGGGRGLMWFTDLDTLVFDMLLLASVIIVVRRRRDVSPNAVFWLLTVALSIIALLLVYTVSNFGTLFRLRAIVYTGLALIPLALLGSFREEPLDRTNET